MAPAHRYVVLRCASPLDACDKHRCCFLLCCFSPIECWRACAGMFIDLISAFYDRYARCHIVGYIGPKIDVQSSSLISVSIGFSFALP